MAGDRSLISAFARGLLVAIVLSGCLAQNARVAADGGAPADSVFAEVGAPAGADATGGSPSAVDLGAPPADLGGAGTCQPCTSWSTPESRNVAMSPLEAISGMAASWRNPGIVYVHNDWDVPVFYALSERGALRGSFTVEAARPLDLEDMAVGPCGAGIPTTADRSCVYLADTGNNRTPRTEFTIYRAREPLVGETGPAIQATLPGERFEFRYADSPHNTESLVVDPLGGAVFLITKEEPGEPSAAYQLETFERGQVNRAVKLAALPVPAPDDQPATAAAAHPCGTGLLLRTGNRLYEFRIAPGTPFAEAFRVAPVVVPSADEPQSEAVTYRPDGRAFFTAGEQTADLHRSTCTAPAPDACERVFLGRDPIVGVALDRIRTDQAAGRDKPRRHHTDDDTHPMDSSPELTRKTAVSRPERSNRKLITLD